MKKFVFLIGLLILCIQLTSLAQDKKIDYSKISKNKIVKYDSLKATDFPKEMQLYLDSLVGYMKQNVNVKATINGQSDGSGTFIDNERYSKKRTQRVIQYLLKNGIDKARVIQPQGAKKNLMDRPGKPGKDSKDKKIEKSAATPSTSKVNQVEIILKEDK